LYSRHTRNCVTNWFLLSEISQAPTCYMYHVSSYVDVAWGEDFWWRPVCPVVLLHY